MKNLLIIAAILGTSSVCFSADISRYQYVQALPTKTITQPAIAQISHLDQSRVYVVVNDKGEAVEQQFRTDRKRTVVPPVRVDGCVTTCTSANALADDNQNTTFDFSLENLGTQKGKIVIVYAKPIETDSVIFRTTGDSYMPNAFTLVIDGKRILNTISGSSVRFPKMMAQKVEIEFDYNQPIRFREVGVGVVEEIEENNMIRFVYLPGSSYTLYAGVRISRENPPTPPINLFAKNVEVELVPESEKSNTLYKEQEPEKNKDTDSDGVVDILDNCPMQKNEDQKDGNGNGSGDVCDDYDYDGVATYRDNCPEVSNFDQRDTDRDGMGDACDGEESRFTEKYTWVPWSVFTLVFLIIMGMGYEMMRMRKNNKED